METMKRGKVGDTVRLYGYPGTYKILGRTQRGLYDWLVQHVQTGREFSTLDESIVELNGQRVPLVSLPLVPPAEDWPYERTLVSPREKDRALPLFAAVQADSRFTIA